MLKKILLVGILILFGNFRPQYLFKHAACWCEERNFVDIEKNIREILVDKEWVKYQELEEYQKKCKEISKKYWKAVGPSGNTQNPQNKEEAQKYKKKWEEYDKIYEKKVEEFWNLLTPQLEKVFLLAIESDKKDPEAGGWILTRSFSDMRTNPETFLKSYLYFNKYQHTMRSVFKNSIEKGMY